jgi:hypothetical protein
MESGKSMHQNRCNVTLCLAAVLLGLVLMLLVPAGRSAAVSLSGPAFPPLQSPLGTPIVIRTPPPTGPARTASDVAYIELHVTSAHAGLYSVVQWPGRETWHDVDGWRHAVDTDGTWRWAVAPRDYGTGPFRWAIYDCPQGQLLATTPLFRLPKSAGELVVLDAVIVPK